MHRPLSILARLAICLPMGMASPALTEAAALAPYEAQYRAEIRPAAGTIHMEIRLSGERLPSRIVLQIDPRRHRDFQSTDKLTITDGSVTWRPTGRFSRLGYNFVVNHERSPGRYDSRLTPDWALFRGDRLVPRASVTAPVGLNSRATLQFTLPAGWSAITPWQPDEQQRYPFDDPRRAFDRPAGWMLAGKIGSRGEMIAGVRAIVAAPVGDSARRQDTLAFLNWNLPRLLEVFPAFPQRLLIVCAGDPMWRGGLSGPASLFMHSDRPLISENRTSSLLHELVHVAMGISSDEESDWIVEGFAEFYSIETLHRSGSISEQRYTDAMQRLAEWADRAPTLFTDDSSGAQTARAVITLKAADEEIRAATRGKASLDEVARELAGKRGKVSLEVLQAAAQQVAGRPLRALDRSVLSRSR